MRKSRTTTAAIGFRNKIWGEKPRLDSRVVAEIETGEVQPSVLEELAKLYRLISF